MLAAIPKPSARSTQQTRRLPIPSRSRRESSRRATSETAGLSFLRLGSKPISSRTRLSRSATQRSSISRLILLPRTLWTSLILMEMAHRPPVARPSGPTAMRTQTLVRHNGLIAPTDNSFGEFIDGILTIKSGFPH